MIAFPVLRYGNVTSDAVLDREHVNVVTMKVDEDISVIIADRFYKELYCEKWTGAFQRLTTTFKRDEKKALQILMDFCTVSLYHT